MRHTSIAANRGNRTARAGGFPSVSRHIPYVDCPKSRLCQRRRTATLECHIMGGHVFNYILVPLDGSPIAEQAVPVAVSLARASCASIDFVLVHEPRLVEAGRLADGLELARWDAEEAYVERIAAETRTTAQVPVTHLTPAGAPASMIAARAADERADLIVMTSHGRTGFSRAWLGSVADSIVRHSHVPVLLLRSDEARARGSQVAHFKRILVPLDGSALAEEMLGPAAALAQCGGGTLVLLHVVRPVPTAMPAALGMPGLPMAVDEDATHVLVHEAQRELRQMEQQACTLGAPRTETHIVVEPAVANAILDFATEHQIDAIAMSTHGRGASRLLVGSIADKVLRGSSIPILMQRPSRMTEVPAVTASDIEQQLTSVSGG